MSLQHIKEPWFESTATDMLGRLRCFLFLFATSIHFIQHLLLLGHNLSLYGKAGDYKGHFKSDGDLPKLHIRRSLVNGNAL